MSQVVAIDSNIKPGNWGVLRVARVSLLCGALLLVGILHSFAEAAPMPRNQTKALRCQQLEMRVGQCAKVKRASRKARERCIKERRNFRTRCYSGAVCGQPPMKKCPDGLVCPTVMPAVKSYDSMAPLKAEGASFLYYGVCLS